MHGSLQLLLTCGKRNRLAKTLCQMHVTQQLSKFAKCYLSLKRFIIVVQNIQHPPTGKTAFT